MFTTESKSQLAKLLAEENLRVEHRKTKTAYFDLKTRTLVCPIWKDMSGAIYDLLMGHEVGHALYTPSEGWHQAIEQRERTNFKFFLNVLEDARIEKKMKRKFPGLTASFRAAYQQFRKDNFFGIDGKNVAELPLIDRLNLLAKGGNLLESRFAPEEVDYVTRMESLETWDEVVALAEDLYAYAQDHETHTASDDLMMDDESSEFGEDDQDANDLFDEMMDQLQDGDTDSDDAADSEESDDAMRRMETTSSSSDETEDNNENKQKSKSQASSGRNKKSREDRPDPTSYTDEFFRQKEESLLSKDSMDLVYVSMPTPKLNRIVTKNPEVIATLKKQYQHVDPAIIQIAYTDFMRKNDAYVSLLAKEFEMKKAATTYRKSKRADTGDLNITKLYRYKLLDDVIFKKRTKIYKGKSHGIVLLLDKSGSMGQMMQDSIEQILVLALFCRKVQIPFAAYSFSSVINYDKPDTTASAWNFRPNDLDMNFVSLREIVNSRMTSQEFCDAVRYQSFLAKQYENYSGYGIPREESLQSTPLNEALVAMDEILQTFRQEYRVDLAHLIIVQDGQSDGNYRIHTKSDQMTYIRDQERVVITDDRSRMSWIAKDSGYGLTAAILKWLKQRQGVHVFGMYVIPSSSRYIGDALMPLYRTKTGSVLSSSPELQKMMDQFKEDQYLESFADGYTRFSFILAKKKARQEIQEDLDGFIRGSATKAKVGTAFAKMYEKKAMNRLLATKFIPLIAAGDR